MLMVAGFSRAGGVLNGNRVRRPDKCAAHNSHLAPYLAYLVVAKYQDPEAMKTRGAVMGATLRGDDPKLSAKQLSASRTGEEPLCGEWGVVFPRDEARTTRNS